VIRNLCGEWTLASAAVGVQTLVCSPSRRRFARREEGQKDKLKLELQQKAPPALRLYGAGVSWRLAVSPVRIVIIGQGLRPWLRFHALCEG